ncbi:hypothetical protein BB561_001145 [Smittium simulii]|uniref:Uncharacterized protein n=1 Tax=Smittium simulii TaxID=133385 RepID=A0A2T9YVV6_9FUNG|nr:hypothetical protein BB561_001145 [Smittium simulii]
MLKIFFQKLETVNFPWSKTRYIGADLRGNLYFERKRSGFRSKRIVKYNEGNKTMDYNTASLSDLLAEQKRLSDLAVKVNAIQQKELQDKLKSKELLPK